MTASLFFFNSAVFIYTSSITGDIHWRYSLVTVKTQWKERIEKNNNQLGNSFWETSKQNYCSQTSFNESDDYFGIYYS